MSALSAYDPVTSVAFSQLGFTALYATFGASPTSRINTAFTYRLNYQGFRVAAQAQVGGYDQDNATTEQYQAQIGTDFNGFSFDAIAGYAKNALTFQSFGGASLHPGSIPTTLSARRPRIRAESSCSAATSGKSSNFTPGIFTRSLSIRAIRTIRMACLRLRQGSSFLQAS